MHKRSANSVATPLWILAGIAAAWFLREARPLFVPVAIAALLSFALAPVVRSLVAVHVPRLAAAALLLGVIASAAVWGTYAAGDNIAQTVQSLPQTIQQVRERMRNSPGGSLLSRLNRVAIECARSAAPGAVHRPAQ